MLLLSAYDCISSAFLLYQTSCICLSSLCTVFLELTYSAFFLSDFGSFRRALWCLCFSLQETLDVFIVLIEPVSVLTTSYSNVILCCRIHRVSECRPITLYVHADQGQRGEFAVNNVIGGGCTHRDLLDCSVVVVCSVACFVFLAIPLHPPSSSSSEKLGNV